MTNITLFSTFLFVSALAATTFLHHLYGGVKYYTPKVNRIKIAWVIAATYALTAALYFVSRSVSWVSFVYGAVVLLWWVGGLGVFEGGYNHLAKVVLWLARVKPARLEKIFPPDEYVLPNDVLFEGSGILTFVLGVIVVASIF